MLKRHSNHSLGFVGIGDRPITFKNAWMGFWFRGHHPYDLCFARPWFYLFLYYFLADTVKNVATLQALDLQTAWMPISFFKWLPLPALSLTTLENMSILWRVAVVLAAAGMWTRISTKIVFFLGIYIVGLGYNYGKIDHCFHLPLVISGILAFSRCGDYWSLDGWIRGNKNVLRHGPAPEEAYRWPLMLARVYIVLIYFEAGFQKLTLSGSDWVFSENFQVMLLSRPTVTSAGLWLASYPMLCKFVAGLTLVAQVSAPLALVRPAFAFILIPLLFSFHIGTYLFMGAHGYFIPYDMAYVFWVPWAFLFHKLFA